MTAAKIPARRISIEASLTGRKSARTRYGQRQNQTKKALWELDNLCRTLFILTFIDEVGLRQSVQKALNRGEAYHRFRRAICYVNAGKFRVKTGTAYLERVLAPDRQRGHLLQHVAAVARVRPKARIRRPRGRRHRQRYFS
jgi:hypothetical protein